MRTACLDAATPGATAAGLSDNRKNNVMEFVPLREVLE